VTRADRRAHRRWIGESLHRVDPRHRVVARRPPACVSTMRALAHSVPQARARSRRWRWTSAREGSSRAAR
jgi:hypothetical protein